MANTDRGIQKAVSNVLVPFLDRGKQDRGSVVAIHQGKRGGITFEEKSRLFLTPGKSS